MASEGHQFSRNDVESSEEMAELLFPKRRLCFCFPCYGSQPSGPNWWHRMRAPGTDGTWWSRGFGALKKLRDWSEIVAGPRWKTFIRRFNRKKSGGKSSARFQYDPLSYALNFDDGAGQNGDLDEEYGFRNFSCRYAAIPESSVDFGKDAPALA